MKRLMPSSLITFLQNNRACLKADLFSITLPTGTVLNATEGQWDITVPAGTPGWSGAQTTFSATQYGVWSRGAITSEASFKCAANTMSLTCIPQPGTGYPGIPLGIISAALNHLFDGATVQVFTAYMPVGQYGTVSNGIETKFLGTITRTPTIARNKIEFECADPMYLLNMKVPSRLMQSPCPWSFCDVNCTLSALAYTVNFTAKTGSTQTSLTPLVAFTQAAGYFNQGVVKCLTGNNAGLSQTVKSHAGGVLTLMVPWILPVTVGDTFAVLKGCDKSLAMCKAVIAPNGTSLDNSVNFGGTPFVPVPSVSV
jgi:uncharacterized phage protein (TIGR02218 family)